MLIPKAPRKPIARIGTVRLTLDFTSRTAMLASIPKARIPLIPVHGPSIWRKRGVGPYNVTIF